MGFLRLLGTCGARGRPSRGWRAWCPACEDWTETYRERGRLRCGRCDARVLPDRLLIHGFSWKTAFYRGTLLGGSVLSVLVCEPPRLWHGGHALSARSGGYSGLDATGAPGLLG
jgi:hypothetical protein